MYKCQMFVISVYFHSLCRPTCGRLQIRSLISFNEMEIG